jgi:hypothetical protein
MKTVGRQNYPPPQRALLLAGPDCVLGMMSGIFRPAHRIHLAD